MTTPDFPYADLLDLPAYHAPGRPYMPNSDRAAQFAPYKSLVGYEKLISSETSTVLSFDDHQIEPL